MTWIEKKIEDPIMNFLDTLFGQAVASPIKAVGNILDKLFTSDEERLDKEVFEVVFVSLDFPRSFDAQKKVAEKIKIPYFSTFYAHDSKIWETFSIEGMPTTLLISPNNGIMYKLSGDADWVSPQSVDFIKSIIDTIE